MSYLLDTNVVSELAKRRKNQGVLDWLSEHRGAEHFLSVLTVGELLRGVERLRARGDRRQADRVEEFVRSTQERFERRILPVTGAMVREWALQDQSRPLPVVDALIAATAAAHDLTVVTRNASHFELAPVRVVDPFTADKAMA